MLHLLNNTFVEALGALTRQLLRVTGKFSRFCYHALQRSASPPWSYRLVMDQAMIIGVRSLPLALITAFFVGAIMVLQTGVQLIPFGAKNTIPFIAFIALAREMIPVFIGFVVGARVAASMAAEIGTMRVTEQLDAMEILNVDPMRYLVAPRVIASTISMPLICTMCLFLGVIGGIVVAWSALNIHPQEYYNIMLRYAYLRDVYSGLFKTIFFGSIMALVGCFFGFNTTGGAEGVGRATTTAVVVTLLLILLANFVLTRLTLIFLGLL